MPLFGICCSVIIITLKQEEQRIEISLEQHKNPKCLNVKLENSLKAVNSTETNVMKVLVSSQDAWIGEKSTAGCQQNSSRWFQTEPQSLRPACRELSALSTTVHRDEK